jgi:hypothetical protein
VAWTASVLPEQWEIWAEVESDKISMGAAEGAGKPGTRFVRLV